MVGEDIGLFYFPPIDPGDRQPRPLLRRRVHGHPGPPRGAAVAQFLATPAAIEAWIKRRERRHRAQQHDPAEWYAGNYKLEIAADLIAERHVPGFDGGDLMPPTVGTGSFWTGIVDWISADGANTDEVLQAIDDSWPTE